MNYDILVGDKDVNGSLRNTLNSSRIPPVWIVEQAQAWLWERLRIREMLTSAAGTMTASATSLDLPARFRSWRDFRFTGTSIGHVALKTPETVREAIGYDSAGVRSTGKPSIAYAAGTTAYFNLAADQAYTYDLLHYAALAPLGSGTLGTNVLTDRGVRALMVTCLAFAAEWDKADADKNRYLQLAQVEVDLINMQGEMEQGGIDEAVIAA